MTSAFFDRLNHNQGELCGVSNGGVQRASMVGGSTKGRNRGRPSLSRTSRAFSSIIGKSQ